ncbi:galactose-3-O-sulfotransferase 3 [Ambystoma mexicanum]|uniref:galactose-3-O-sulfotransferase 3 n=1 Tax=Ambystoma mexicanum TaxID=8296 RepID=UPI0037E81651
MPSLVVAMARNLPCMQRVLKMSRKRILLVLVAFSMLSLLLHQTSHLHWYPKILYYQCAATAGAPKHTAIAFLKTHKTASTTVQNILFRFAEKHNVTVALPHHSCDHQFCYPRNFSARFVHPYTLPPRIITNHMRFNASELRRLMPNDTLYVTILREPVAMFESLFSYYNQYCLSFKRVPNGSMETFLNHPLRYHRPNEKFSMYAHNTLVYDLGGDNDRGNGIAGEAYMNGFIREMEDIFSLVMIAEYFDESLILLKHLLSWDLEDMVYVKLNMRTKESKLNITSSLPGKIRAWNSLDSQLYNHFNATFWKKIREVGAGCVEKEVRLLRQAQEKLMHTCFGDRLRLRSAMQIKNKDLRPWQPSSKVNIIGYDLPGNLSSNPPEHCLKLVMPEIQYSRYLLKKQTLKNRRKGVQRQPPRPMVKAVVPVQQGVAVVHPVQVNPIRHRPAAAQ